MSDSFVEDIAVALNTVDIHTLEAFADIDKLVANIEHNVVGHNVEVFQEVGVDMAEGAMGKADQVEDSVEVEAEVEVSV